MRARGVPGGMGIPIKVHGGLEPSVRCASVRPADLGSSVPVRVEAPPGVQSTTQARLTASRLVSTLAEARRGVLMCSVSRSAVVWKRGQWSHLGPGRCADCDVSNVAAASDVPPPSAHVRGGCTCRCPPVAARIQRTSSRRTSPTCGSSLTNRAPSAPLHPRADHGASALAKAFLAKAIEQGSDLQRRGWVPTFRPRCVRWRAISTIGATASTCDRRCIWICSARSGLRRRG